MPLTRDILLVGAGLLLAGTVVLALLEVAAGRVPTGLLATSAWLGFGLLSLTWLAEAPPMGGAAALVWAVLVHARGVVVMAGCLVLGSVDPLGLAHGLVLTMTALSVSAVGVVWARARRPALRSSVAAPLEAA